MESSKQATQHADGYVAIQDEWLRTAAIKTFLNRNIPAHEPQRLACLGLTKDTPVAALSFVAFLANHTASFCSSVGTAAWVIKHFHSPQWFR